MEKSHALALRRCLSTLFPQRRSHSVAHFRASSGLFGKGRDRVRKPATWWLRAPDKNFDVHHDATSIARPLASRKRDPNNALKRNFFHEETCHFKIVLTRNPPT